MLASLVSQGISKGREVPNASYHSPFPAPFPGYPAPLPVPSLPTHSRGTTSPVGRQVLQGWRGEQEQGLADGTVVVMHQGQLKVVGGAGVGAGQERPSFWPH